MEPIDAQVALAAGGVRQPVRTVGAWGRPWPGMAVVTCLGLLPVWAGVASGLTREYRLAEAAAKADQALARWDEGERFDLVFSDLVMPGRLGGVDLALQDS